MRVVKSPDLKNSFTFDIFPFNKKTMLSQSGAKVHSRLCVKTVHLSIINFSSYVCTENYEVKTFTME